MVKAKKTIKQATKKSENLTTCQKDIYNIIKLFINANYMLSRNNLNIYITDNTLIISIRNFLRNVYHFFIF